MYFKIGGANSKILERKFQPVKNHNENLKSNP
jgi:hypothetical protein